jgi:putative (di)nucleoside polyphosphate hydrolase
VLVNPAGLVFLGERCARKGGLWQMPQGGIDEGETPRDAAMRELLEETGTDKIELMAETRLWHHYQVPEKKRPKYWAGRFVGQSQKWFAFRFVGEDCQIDLERYEPEFARWRWATAKEAIEAAVVFKRDLYKAVLAEFRPYLSSGAS